MEMKPHGFSHVPLKEKRRCHLTSDTFTNFKGEPGLYFVHILTEGDFLRFIVWTSVIWRQRRFDEKATGLFVYFLNTVSVIQPNWLCSSDPLYPEESSWLFFSLSHNINQNSLTFPTSSAPNPPRTGFDELPFCCFGGPPPSSGFAFESFQSCFLPE